jgi:UDP-N-acetylmuramate dehydrogenase
MMKNLEQLRQHFGARLQENIRMAGLTTSRVGGPAACVASCSSAAELAADVQYLWQHDIPLQVLGSGSNILVSDQGVDRVILQNKAKKFVFETLEDQPVVNAESGATLITIVREAAQKGYDDLVWASTIPGTLGGAVYGNAGAHGAEMSCNLVMAEILHREKGMLSMNAEQMQYAYRSSILKRSPGSAVILSAVLSLRPGDPQEIKAAIQANADRRRLTQPSGSSYGSTFKNPAGDSAGRLIEAAGLKGTRIGGVEISTLHANFMINDGTGCAQDYRNLMLMAQKAVFEKFGVKLELEIELIGKWQD